MKKIIYEEFGVRSEIIKYKRISSKLKGMKEGKLFVHNNEIRINIKGNLYLVEEINFFNKSGKSINRKNVCLDTENRIAGVFINSNDKILLLEIRRDREFYCFPGGHKRECETVEECLKREMIEETGIDIEGLDRELLIEIQKEEFGSESFYLIDLKKELISYCDEDPLDITSKLNVHNIKNVFEYSNIFPREVIQKLKEKYQNK